jgi:hypothetical protein
VPVPLPIPVLTIQSSLSLGFTDLKIKDNVSVSIIPTSTVCIALSIQDDLEKVEIVTIHRTSEGLAGCHGSAEFCSKSDSEREIITKTTSIPIFSYLLKSSP